MKFRKTLNLSKNRKRKRKIQYTKRAMTTILVVALFDVQLSYILAFFGRDTLEELSKVIVIEIVGVFLTYCVKSFYETREEKKNELERERYERETDEPEIPD